MVVITWMGGDGNASNSDFSALKGSHVTLWRDNDDAGSPAMDIVARKAQAATLLTVPMRQGLAGRLGCRRCRRRRRARRDEALQARKPYKFDISPKGRPGAWAKVEDGGWLPDHIRPIPGPMGQVKTTSASQCLYRAAASSDVRHARLGHPGRRRSSGTARTSRPASSTSCNCHLNEVCGLEINQGFDKVVESVAIERPFNRLADQIRATPGTRSSASTGCSPISASSIRLGRLRLQALVPRPCRPDPEAGHQAGSDLDLGRAAGAGQVLGPGDRSATPSAIPATPAWLARRRPDERQRHDDDRRPDPDRTG